MAEIKTTLTSDRPLEPGVMLRIVERDECGAMVGFWEGHYSQERRSVMLYPRANPYCWWRVPRVAHPVDESLIRIDRPIAIESRSGTSRTPSPTKKAAEPRDYRKLPLLGQERMEF